MGESNGTTKSLNVDGPSTQIIELAPNLDTISDQKQPQKKLTTPTHYKNRWQASESIVNYKTLSSSTSINHNSIINQQDMDFTAKLKEYSFQKPQILSEKNSNKCKDNVGVKRKFQSNTEFDYSLPLTDRYHLKSHISLQDSKKILHQNYVTNYFSKLAANPGTSSINKVLKPIQKSTIVNDEKNDNIKKNTLLNTGIDQKFNFRFIILTKLYCFHNFIISFLSFSIDDILNHSSESEKDNNTDDGFGITKPIFKSARQTFNNSVNFSPIKHENPFDSIDCNSQYETRRNDLIQKLQENSEQENYEFVRNATVERFSYI